MSFPKNLKYTKDHEWLSLNGKTATIGITDYALEQLGDVVHVELPSVGDEFEIGTAFGTIESTKTVSDLYCPIAGKITEINEDILDNLEGIVENPYQEGWLVKISVSHDKDLEDLLDSTDYENFISEQED